jgi:high-affinity iron transporter
VRTGARPPSALLAVVAIAILREGSEVVLFMYGLAAGGSSVGSLALGGLLGLAAGVAAGVALYSGLIRVDTHRMFSATNGLLVLVAAGMASTAAHFLVQADLLPPLGSPLWDTSALVANGSMPGQLLHALVGYDARPSGMQILFFAAVLAAIGAAMQWLRKSGAPTAPSERRMSPQPS